ncbi:hypothetical protein HMPREF9554_02048 [Treponema phagedenis F0421]|nr:hypothetical protein HMPREF9554_02048 [Treponema phagedenis F0421]
MQHPNTAFFDKLPVFNIVYKPRQFYKKELRFSFCRPWQKLPARF